MYKVKYMCGMRIVRTEEVETLSEAVEKTQKMETGTSAYILDENDVMVFWKNLSKNGVSENLEPAALAEIAKIVEDLDIE